MLPLLLERVISQRASPILPESDSSESDPLVVIGKSLRILPKEVRAVTVYPAPSGNPIRIGAKEDLTETL